MGMPLQNFKKFNLSDLKKNCNDVLGFTPEKRTIKLAYNEVLSKIEDKDLRYMCDNCKTQIDVEMKKCWACGAILDDEDDPIVEQKELESRARKLGLDPDDMQLNDIRSEIERIEKARRSKSRDSNLYRIESNRINELLGEMLPDRWRIKKSGLYNSYFDSNGKRRIAVFHRGLKVHFSVDNGMLDGIDNLEFLDKSERKRRHAGRTNYMFNGEISKNAIAICNIVMNRYKD